MLAAAPARTSKEQFDRQAAHYDRQWNSWNEESLAWMLDRVRLHPNDTVLDVATGAGFTAIAFAPHVKRVVGLDVSTGMLDQARQRATSLGIQNLELKEGPAENMPFADTSFDVVACRIAAHHFLDVQSFLSESHRVLKPGGRFLLADTTVPDNPELDGWQNTIEKVRDPSHVRNYSLTEWNRMAADAGFTILESGVKQGMIRVGVRDWLRKGGCSDRQSAEVYAMLAAASEAIRTAFGIQRLPDGDMEFAWHRIVMLASKSAGYPESRT